MIYFIVSYTMEHFHIESWCQLSCVITLRPIIQSLREELSFKCFKCRFYELFKKKKLKVFQTINAKINEASYRFSFLYKENTSCYNLHKEKALLGSLPFFKS